MRGEAKLKTNYGVLLKQLFRACLISSVEKKPSSFKNVELY